MTATLFYHWHNGELWLMIGVAVIVVLALLWAIVAENAGVKLFGAAALVAVAVIPLSMAVAGGTQNIHLATIKADLTTHHYKVASVHTTGSRPKDLPTATLYDINGCTFTYSLLHTDGHYQPFIIVKSVDENGNVKFTDKFIAPTDVGHDVNLCSYFPTTTVYSPTTTIPTG